MPDSEQKLVILYTLETLGPVTETQLLKFLTDIDAMNYFEMRLALISLADGGEVMYLSRPAGQLLVLTQSGMECIGQFSARIPASRRQPIERHGKEMRRRFRTEQQAQARSFTAADGRQYLQLRLTENDRIFLDMLIRLPDEKRITFVQERWLAVADEIYTEIARYAVCGGGESLDGGLKRFGSANCEMILDLPDGTPTTGNAVVIDPERIAGETIRKMELVGI